MLGLFIEKKEGRDRQDQDWDSAQKEDRKSGEKGGDRKKERRQKDGRESTKRDRQDQDWDSPKNNSV